MNNAGKTSVLKALHLALGDYSRYLSEEDFYIGKDDQRVSEILVDIRIVPINEKGDRCEIFNEDWQAEFEDRIQSDANSFQYVGLRTRSKADLVKGGFDTSYSILNKWTDIENWCTEKVENNRKFSRLTSIQFILIDAQRDIHQEIRDTSSFVGKVLSNIQYNEDEVLALESLIKDINAQAIEKSQDLTGLRKTLALLNQSFQTTGNVEITPFPKKIRDLYKYFSIHFGESEINTFPMEYHGMGIRSWSSILSANAFIELQNRKHEDQEKPFFSILAVEEPESHLHPNAQKTLYKQLEQCNGQVIISTHSHYVVATAKQTELRYLKRTPEGIIVRLLRSNIEEKDRRKLQREVIHSRGEILFAKAIVLCEGETEEQALPLLFAKYFGSEAFVKGVSFIGVGGSGRKYLPFFILAYDFDIPIFIFSDGEEQIIKYLKENYKKIYGTTDIENSPNITILDGKNSDGKNFEEHLVLTSETIIESLIKTNDGEGFIDNWIKNKHNTSSSRKKTRDYRSSDGFKKALIDILGENKTKYAPLIAEKLCELGTQQFPQKILEFFQKIENWGI